MDLPLNPDTPEQKTPASTPQRPKGTRLVLKVGLQAFLVLLFLVAAALGTLSGILFAYAGDLPEISALDNYRPHTITRLIARDGQEIGEFSIERRVVIGYDDMAPVLRQAIIATEDAGFERHFGYATPEHMAAIEKHGPCPIHRMTFSPFAEAYNQPCLTFDA